MRGRLGAWCAVHPSAEAVFSLTSAGLAAAVANDGATLARERQLAGNTLVWRQSGEMVKGQPYTFGGQVLNVERDAPNLGEHTEQVLKNILGLDEAAINRLAALGVTCAEPFAQVA